MGQKFKIVLHADVAALGALFEAFAAYKEFIEVEGCTAVDKPEVPEKKARYANGTRNKGMTGRELIHRMLAGGKPIAREKIAAEFARLGFAGNSYSAAMSAAVKAGEVVRCDGGRKLKLVSPAARLI